MGSLMQGLMGGSKKTKLPKVTPTPVMPVSDDAAVQAAMDEQLKKRQSQQGRLSTILSDSQQGADSLG